MTYLPEAINNGPAHSIRPLPTPPINSVPAQCPISSLPPPPGIPNVASRAHQKNSNKTFNSFYIRALSRRCCQKRALLAARLLANIKNIGRNDRSGNRSCPEYTATPDQLRGGELTRVIPERIGSCGGSVKIMGNGGREGGDCGPQNSLDGSNAFSILISQVFGLP